MGEFVAEPIAGTEGSVTSPAFSPDGQWLVYTNENRLEKISIGGGAPIAVSELEGHFGLSWERDNEILLIGNAGVLRIDAELGTSELLVPKEDGESIFGAQFLPGSNAVLFSSTRASGDARWDEAQIVAYSVASGERTVVWSGGSDARYLEATGYLLFARENALFGVPFDPERLRVSGEPEKLVEDLRRAYGPVEQLGDGELRCISIGHPGLFGGRWTRPCARYRRCVGPRDAARGAGGDATRLYGYHRTERNWCFRRTRITRRSLGFSISMRAPRCAGSRSRVTTRIPSGRRTARG